LRYTYGDPELNHEKYCGCVNFDKRYTDWGGLACTHHTAGH